MNENCRFMLKFASMIETCLEPTCMAMLQSHMYNRVINW